MTVINQYGKEIYYEAAVAIMDDDLREELHNIGYETEQEFFDAYCEAHEERFGAEFECAKPNPCY